MRGRLSNLAFGVALWGSMGALSGCGESVDTPLSGSGTVEESPNLVEEFGGYTATDEPAAFGDEALAATAEMEVDVEDAMAADEAVRDLGSDPRATIYALTVTWGQLDRSEIDDPSQGGDDPQVEPLIWDGSLSVSEGAIVLRRVIAFERGDHTVRPRDDRKVLEWESTTGPHYDGIRVLVYAPPPSDGTPDVEPHLSFATGPLTQSFALADLEALNELIRVDDQGNGVHFLAQRTTLDQVAQGWLFGTWSPPAGVIEGGDGNDTPPADGELGHFKGRWVSARGGVVGFVRGHYGVTDEGERRFFGKYIDRTGNFQGFLRGTWEIDEGDAESGAGTFAGRWHSATGASQGVVRGTWVTSPRGGLFTGRWAAADLAP